jgi:hypothetical protein
MLIFGTHKSVSDEKLQSYCNEVAFKHTHSKSLDYGFSVFLENFTPLANTYSIRRNVA